MILQVPVHGFVQDTGLDLGEKCPKKILICCGEIIEEMALEMGLYWFFKCGMYCTNITQHIGLSYVPTLINKMATRCQQYVAYANLGSDVVPGRVSELSEQVHPSSAFVLPMFTMFHPCASIFPHFHQHVAPRELGSCIFFVKNPLAGVRQQERSCRCKMHSLVKAGSTQTNNGWVQRCSCLRA